MTVLQQMTSAEQFTELWRVLMPDLEPPDLQQFLLWVGTHSDELVSRGINRAGAKARKLRGTVGAMSGHDAVRYAASVMKNESLGIQRHEPNGTQRKQSE
jgi:hypothetical protein